MAKSNWDPCPNCGGKVTKDVSAYKESQQQWNQDTEGIDGDQEIEVVTAEEAPTGGVGICSRCGMAVAAPDSEDAALAEPEEGVQMPVESPEHYDAPSAGTPPVEAT
jgi:hypothetical protein